MLAVHVGICVALVVHPCVCFFPPIQEKYKRDQEKLQEEWTNAQKDISKSPIQQEVTARDASYPLIL